MYLYVLDMNSLLDIWIMNVFIVLCYVSFYR